MKKGRKMQLIRLLSLSFLSLMTLSGVHAGTSEQVTDYMLDNGMQVVVIEDHRAPVVVHMVWYKAGSGEEDPGVSGVAHFLEHLLFKKSKTRSQEFSELLPKMEAAGTPLPALIIPAIFNGLQQIDCRS